MNIRPAIAVAALVTAATLFTGCGTFGSEPSTPRADTPPPRTDDLHPHSPSSH